MWRSPAEGGLGCPKVGGGRAGTTLASKQGQKHFPGVF